MRSRSFMVVVIGTIALLAAWQGIRYLGVEIEREHSSRRHAALYTVLVQVFVACMLGAVLAANLGAMWVAVEATTIATTFLVGHRRNDRALEASWKYVIICSVGIALAFLGTVLVYFAALHPLGLHGVHAQGPRSRSTGPSLMAARAISTRASCASRWRSWSSATAPRSVSHRCTAGFPTRTARLPRRSPR